MSRGGRSLVRLEMNATALRSLFLTIDRPPMRPWQKPFRRYVFALGDVYVDRDIARAIHAAKLRVTLDEKRSYAYLVMVKPGLPGAVFVNELHRWIWDVLVARNRRRKLRDDEVIHHDDHNKLNNQAANLRAVSRARHALEHEHDRQKFSPRRRDQLFGFYSPRAPGPVRRVQSTAFGISGPAKPAALRVQTLRRTLAEMLPSVRERVCEFGCWLPRPKPRRNWNDPDNFRLGIRRGRRRLTNSDAALVGVMILHHMDAASVASELGCRRELVEQLVKQPLVHDALLYFLRTTGLPYALLAKKAR
jgi:hypothetical protein